MKKLFVVGLLMFSSMVLAAGAIALVAEGTFDRAAVFKPQLFIKGFFVGPELGSAKVTNSKENKVTGIYSGKFDFDFPAIGPGGAGQAGGHIRTPGMVLKGVQIGDPCIVGVDKTMIDGGYAPDLELRAHVQFANSVILEAVAQLYDAGSIDMPDASYKVTCFSSQAPL